MAATGKLLRFALLSLLLGAGACDEEEPEAVGTESDGGAEMIALPSGSKVSLLEIKTDLAGPDGATARFRFIDKSLTNGEDRSADMQSLCDTYAIERISGMVPEPRQIVITLADRPVPFGEADPEAVQFFEAYRVENAACIWEMF